MDVVIKKESSLAEDLLLREINTLKDEIVSLKSQIAQQQSAEQDFSLRKILSLMPGNVFWKDKTGKFLGVNNNLAKLLGLSSPEEIIGKYNHDLVSPEIAAALSEVDEKSINLEGRSFEENGLDVNGNPAIYFTQKHALHNAQGETIGIIGISMDITERKKIEHELKLAKENAETSNQAKSQFLAMVNHELRTPLTGILGLVGILKDQLSNLNIPNNTISLIHNLNDCSQYLLSMVNDVLDFSKLEANQHKADIKAADLNSISRQVFSMLEKLAAQKKLNLTIESKKDLPLLLTDEKAISQILVNLINNSIKFTQAGEVKLTITHYPVSANILHLTIAVTDTGQGIPEDKIDTIFEPFKQLQNTYIHPTSRSGTGLGLTIVKKLTESLGCSIKVSSNEGVGSTFTVSGNFTIATNTNGISPIEQIEATGTKRKKILLVEDDKIVQMVHRHMLRELNCEVHVAQNGKEALSLLDNYDLAFIDIGLTDMTGFDLIKHIKKYQYNKNNHFPLIALTGYTGEEIKQQSNSAGANALINKPISKEKMKEILHEYQKFPPTSSSSAKAGDPAWHCLPGSRGQAAGRQLAGITARISPKTS